MSPSPPTNIPTPLDSSAVRWLIRHTPAWTRKGGQAAVVGRTMLAFQIAIITTTAPLLQADGRTGVWASTALVAGALLAASLWAPWRRLPAVATIVFPVASLGALLAIALGTDGLALAYVGLIPVCFVYAGLFHHAWVGVALLPLAAVAYIATLSSLNAAAWLRVGIYCAAWLAISLTLAASASRHRAATELLRAATTTDALTRLGNRRGLDERLTRLGPGDCVVICDLDHFKLVNDTLGHAAGDVVLERFGHTLSALLRGRDYAARFGGEEFVLVLARTRPGQALTLLSTLRAEWSEASDTTFSAGVASHRHGLRPTEVLAAADAAMYRAKNEGRDCVRLAEWDCDVPPFDCARGVESGSGRAIGRDYGDVHI